MASSGATSRRCNLERLRGWLQTGRNGTRPCRRRLPIRAWSCPTPHCLPGSSLNRLGNLRGRKNRTVQIRVLPSPLWGCRPPTQAGTALWAPEEGKQIGTAAGGRELGTLLHHQFEPCDIFLPSPCHPSGYHTHPHPEPGAQAQMPAPRHKRSVFIFKAGCCPLRICPLEGRTCDCTPCPEPKRDRRQPLAGDIAKYEPGTKSQVPRPPLP